MSRKQILITLVCVAIVVVAAAVWFIVAPGASDSSTLPGSGERYGVTVHPDDRTMGSPRAPIVMLEYAAPTCPHCAHFNIEFLPTLKRNYIDTGKVFYIFRVFPLGPADIAAESIARCLPADNYFQFLDLLYRNQPKWDPEYQPPDVHAGLVEMGRIAGLSQAQVDNCIGNQAEAQRATQVGQEATQKYAVDSTPTFIVNGQMHGPFTDLQQMEGFLNSVLPKK